MNIKREAVKYAAHEFLRTVFGVEKTNYDTSFVVENLLYGGPDMDLMNALKNDMDTEKSLYLEKSDAWKIAEENLTHFYGVSEDAAEKIIEKIHCLLNDSTINRLSRYLSDKNGDGTYAIMQVKEGDAYRGIRFEVLDYIEEPLLIDDYDFVYSGRIDALNAVYDPSLALICDQIYRKFNEHRPEDYTGRSISVSDIIILRYRGDVSVFYVNPFEFTELPDFLVDD